MQQERKKRFTETIASIREQLKNVSMTEKFNLQLEEYVKNKLEEIRISLFENFSSRQEFIEKWERLKSKMLFENHLKDAFADCDSLKKLKGLSSSETLSLGAKFIGNCHLIIWIDNFIKIGNGLSSLEETANPNNINVTGQKANSVFKETIDEIPEMQKAKNRLDSKSPSGMPKGFEKIPGKLSDQEIKRFFYFLCLEKDRDGIPILPKHEVDKLLENGFGVGEKPTGKYFNLNINSKQKGLIKYCFYRLYKCHEGDVSIRDAIVRFMIFNFEQFKPKDGKYNAKVHENFSRNLNGIAPRRMPFLISPRYLPDPK